MLGNYRPRADAGWCVLVTFTPRRPCAAQAGLAA
jgi:hypothetical protein